MCIHRYSRIAAEIYKLIFFSPNTYMHTYIYIYVYANPPIDPQKRPYDSKIYNWKSISSHEQRSAKVAGVAVLTV